MEGKTKEVIDLTKFFLNFKSTTLALVYVVSFILFSLFLFRYSSQPFTRIFPLLLLVQGSIIVLLPRLFRMSIRHSLLTMTFSNLLSFFAFLIPSLSIWKVLNALTLNALALGLVVSFFFTKLIRAILLSLFYGVVLLLLILNPNQWVMIPSFFLSYTVLFLLSASIYWIVNYLFSHSTGITLRRGLSSFFNSWFGRDSSIEEIMDEVGISGRVKVSVFKFHGKKPFTILIPYFHFGPFSVYGSSAFPGLAVKHLGRVAVFHGPSTHDLNLTSQEEAKKVLKEISKVVLGATKKRGKLLYGMGKNSTERAYVLGFPNSSLAFLTRAPKTTEDMSAGSGYFLERELLRHFPYGAVVDLHNSSAKTITRFSEDSEVVFSYKKALEKALSSLKPVGAVKAGYARRDCKVLSSAGASVAVFDLEKEKLALVVLDGNGISDDCRKKLERMLVGMGVTPLIATTDSHEANNISGVVNEIECSEELEEAVKEAVEEALRDVEEREVSYVEVYPRVKVLGGYYSVEFITTISLLKKIVYILVPLVVILAFIWLWYSGKVFGIE